ncbi:MAG: hypothetical protein IIV81_02700 [Clostridia bacterium]|nr:hypothetical protein [Clostridia bacterium]
MKQYRLAKYSCYLMGVTMAVVCSLSPLLFVTFRESYGTSYTLLGFLVVVNFLTQLSVDLILSFFPHKLNIELLIRKMPVIAFAGVIIYAVMPMIFPRYAYLWIALGTFVFSASSGLCEVLTSPIIAAIPADNLEKEMSKFHSVYAWGLVFVVIIGSFILHVIGDENWHYLALIFSVVPLLASFTFSKAELPPLEISAGTGKEGSMRGLAIFILFIFIAGSAECTMTQWVSGYAEKALGIPKMIGDVFGMAAFGFFLALGRTLHSKGLDTAKTLKIGIVGAFFTYVIATLSPYPYLGLAACALTGYFTAVLWPGSLILMSERFPTAGVTAYALMASGGDLGVSVAPQLVGIIADLFAESDIAKRIASLSGFTTEEVGMRAGLLIGSLFCVVGFIILLKILKQRKNNEAVHKG